MSRRIVPEPDGEFADSIYTEDRITVCVENDIFHGKFLKKFGAL